MYCLGIISFLEAREANLSNAHLHDAVADVEDVAPPPCAPAAAYNRITQDVGRREQQHRVHVALPPQPLPLNDHGWPSRLSTQLVLRME